MGKRLKAARSAEVGEQTESRETQLYRSGRGKKLTDHCKAVRVGVLKAEWVGQSRCLEDGLKVRSRKTRRDLDRHLSVH